MKFLRILVRFILSLFAGKYKNHASSCLVTFSDALPIQFWPVQQETFNEKEVSGIFSKCWCQPFNCDDRIVLQLYDDRAVVTPTTANIAAGTAPQYSTTSLNAAWSDWNTGTATVVMNTSNPVSTEILYFLNPFNVGQTYDFDFSVTGTGTYTAGGGNALSCIVGFFDASFNSFGGNTLLSATGSTKTTSGMGTFTVPLGAVYIGFQASAATVASGSYSIKINYFTATQTYVDYDLKVYNSTPQLLTTLPFVEISPGIYQLSFIPGQLSPDICEGKVSFVITNSDLGELYKSDCIDIKVSHDETVLINYSNSRDFAGLSYSDVSPDPEFSIRIPATFFHERYPEEDEVLELSNSQMIQLNSQVKAQRHLRIGPLPYYMHRKMKLVLKHQFIEIDDVNWIKGADDPYEIIEGNPKWPLKQASVWLTEKNYIKRNVL